MIMCPRNIKPVINSQYSFSLKLKNTKRGVAEKNAKNLNHAHDLCNNIWLSISEITL